MCKVGTLTAPQSLRPRIEDAVQAEMGYPTTRRYRFLHAAGEDWQSLRLLGDFPDNGIQNASHPNRGRRSTVIFPALLHRESDRNPNE
ncbi:MAG: hypothetical protein RLZZ133_799 [Pseudomonadota bacterium]